MKITILEKSNKAILQRRDDTDRPFYEVFKIGSNGGSSFWKTSPSYDRMMSVYNDINNK